VKIANLNQIEIYQQSLLLAQQVYALTKNNEIIKEFALNDQLKRAALSVPANIAEGYGRRSKKDFAQFLSIALGSANELIAYFDFILLEFKIDTSHLKAEYDILAKRIYSFRSYLQLPQHTTHNAQLIKFL
jgi:four helix bundle protein